MKEVNAAIAIIGRGGKLLITQRKSDDFYGGFWEFPGGAVEPGESLEECIHRELREEIDIKVQCQRMLRPIEHHYPHALVRLHPFICEHVEGEVKLIECQDARWIEPDALTGYRFPPANENLLKEIVQLFQEMGREIGQSSSRAITSP